MYRKSIPGALSSYGVILVVFIACANPAGADTVTWGGGTGDWFVAGNWAPAQTPSNGDAVVINAGSVLLTNLTADLESLTMGGGTLTFSNWTTKVTATNVSIAAGTVTLPAAFTNNAMSNRVWIVCSNLFVASGGSISTDGKGYKGGPGSPAGDPGPYNGNGPGYGRSIGWDHGSGAGHGGKGGDAGISARQIGGSVYDSASEPTSPGSGGGGGASSAVGGNGGGAALIDATGTVTINGAIYANGTAGGGFYGGGGSGGGIYITCNIFAGTNGVVSASGGNGGSSAGGGGGGRIAVAYNPAAQSSAPLASVRFSVLRGSDGPNAAWPATYEKDNYFGTASEMGTLYFPDTSILDGTFMPHSGNLIITNFTSWALNSLTISNGTLRFVDLGFNLVVTNNIIITGATGALHMATGGVIACGGNLTLTNGGKLYVYGAVTNIGNPDYGSLVSVTGDISIASNSWVYPYSQNTNGGSPLFRMQNLMIFTNGGFNADAKGFDRGGDGSTAVNGLGPGYGYGSAGARSTGAGYGGRGGRSDSVTNRGATYGLSNAPVHPGSSGGGGGGFGRMGARGGGLIRVEAGDTIRVDGTLTANAGAAGSYGGGGAGGGIYIVCRTFNGNTNALLRANGGNSGWTSVCGAGGGGRIAVVRVPTRHNYQGAYSATNGVGYTNDVEVGTIAFVQHPYVPLITNEAPTNISSTNAWLIGNLTATGSPPTEVYVFWGTNDGQTVKGNWATNDYLGTNDVGWVTNKIYFLTSSTRYYYRFYATNSFDHEWATVTTNFTTLGPPIAVDNDSGATNITTTAATLRGEATGGNPTPTAYVFWGPTDENTNKSAWSNTVDLGAQADNFSTVVTGLLANKTYYYRCYASNSYDSVWATATTNFTTIPPTLSISNNVQLGEGNAGATNADFAVTLSATSAVNVTVQFAASNGTATVAGGDFDATNGTLAIDAGAMSGTIRVVVNGDAGDEYPYEEFYVNLSNAVNATIGVAQGVCQVLDEDDAKQAKTWTGSGNWTARTNWSPAGMPGPLDDAVVASGSTTLSNATTVSSLAVSNGATFVFTNWTTKLTVASNVTVYGAITLPAAFTNGVMSNRVWIACSNFTVASGGSINVDGKGYAGGTNSSNGNGPGCGSGEGGGHASGAGHGGQGGEAGSSLLLAGGAVYGSAGAPLTPGSGGGSGSSGNQAGAGGGAVWIEATGAVTINGTVTANGATGGAYTGGGSGGGIYITCNTLAGAGGTARANAGNGISAASGGGGGRIAVIYDTNAQSSASVPAIVFSCSPGVPGSSPGWLFTNDKDNHYGSSTGRLGTIYFPDTSLLTNTMAHNGILTISGFNNWAVNNLTVSNGNFRISTDGFALTVTNQLTVRDGGRFELTNAAVTCGSLLLTNGAFVIYGGSTSRPTLAVNGDLEMYGAGSTQAVFFIYSGQTNMVNQGNGAAVTVGGDMFLTNNAWVYPVSHPTNGGSVMFSVSNLTIASANAGFNADARGFNRRDSAQSTQNGLGQGFGYGNSSRATGAGYGGRGGRSDSVTNRGATYGSADAPVDPGSSGGSGSIERLGSKGGGAVRISADDTVTVHGTITANAGLPGNYGGGGSGGGIYIACRTFSGNATGMLRANGGNSGWTAVCGAGGGGRIAVWRNADQHFYTGSYSVTNGSGSYSNDVEVGTIKLINNSSGGTMFKFL